MKKLLIMSLSLLALASCKDEQGAKNRNAPLPTSQTSSAPAAPAEPLTVEELALQSLARPDDWAGDVGLYLETISACVQSAPVPVKYVFKADSFEAQDTTLVLFKGENDRVYGCSFQGNNIPQFREIRVAAPVKGERFYPGSLPKPDSCLTNTRILNKSGQTAGWLSRITC